MISTVKSFHTGLRILTASVCFKTLLHKHIQCSIFRARLYLTFTKRFNEAQFSSLVWPDTEKSIYVFVYTQYNFGSISALFRRCLIQSTSDFNRKTCRFTKRKFMFIMWTESLISIYTKYIYTNRPIYSRYIMYIQYRHSSLKS